MEAEKARKREKFGTQLFSADTRENTPILVGNPSLLHTVTVRFRVVLQLTDAIQQYSILNKSNSIWRREAKLSYIHQRDYTRPLRAYRPPRSIVYTHQHSENVNTPSAQSGDSGMDRKPPPLAPGSLQPPALLRVQNEVAWLNKGKGKAREPLERELATVSRSRPFPLIQVPRDREC